MWLAEGIPRPWIEHVRGTVSVYVQVASSPLFAMCQLRMRCKLKRSNTPSPEDVDFPAPGLAGDRVTPVEAANASSCSAQANRSTVVSE